MYALTDSISELLDQPIREGSVNAMVHCPFHEDRTPSFSIHLEEGVWHCFSCGDSGTLNRLYRELGKDVDLDVRLYQAKKNSETSFVRTKNFAAKANGCIRDLGGKNGQGRLLLDQFLAARGIGHDTARLFGVGYDKERDALSFPYADLDGRVTGIKYRYRNGFKASESGSHYGLYGVNNVVGKEQVIICEGESDTLGVHSRYGERYGVAGTSGASVSESQWAHFSISLLFAKRVFLAYDADDAGDDCYESARSVLGDKVIRLRPTRGKDVSDAFAAGETLEQIGLR